MGSHKRCSAFLRGQILPIGAWIFSLEHSSAGNSPPAAKATRTKDLLQLHRYIVYWTRLEILHFLLYVMIKQSYN